MRFVSFNNLINSDWGIVEIPNNVSPIAVSVDSNTNIPTYTFNTQTQKTFGSDSSLASRWQAQFGLRFVF